MQTVVITPPAQPLVTASVARARLGLSSGVVDDTIAAFIAAASQVLDGPDGWLGRSIGSQTLELQMESFPWAPGYGCPEDYPVSYGYNPQGVCIYSPTIKLICPPIASIVSVKYIDSTGQLQTLDPATYELDGRNLTPAYGKGWPSTRFQPKAVQIRYQAGYDADKIPAPIIQAIMMSVATMNAMTKADPLLTQDTVIGVASKSWQTATDVGAIYERAAQALLAPYRVID